MSTPADQPTPAADRDPAVAARVEQLYTSHGALVRSVCRSLLRDRAEAEDAVQQTFLSAQRALVNGSSPREPAAWLATIARHESLARVRARMREPLPVEVEDHEAAPDAHAAAVRRHEAGELRDALAELPAQQREAILLREVRGFSYQEVAASLSVTPSAVESLLFRARRSLQVRLQEALATLSPGAWAQPLRELAARLASGGLAAPAAAKVAAVGLGTAVVTGGALVGPRVLSLGHTPPAASHASLPSEPRVSHPAEAPVAFSAKPIAQPAGVGSADRVEVSDRQTASDTRERGRSSETTSDSASLDASSTSGSTRDARDGATAAQDTAVTDDSRTSTTAGDSSSSSSGTTTPPPGTPDD